MSFDPHANFAKSKVAIPPDPVSSGTTLTVTLDDGALFPTPPFNCSVYPEGEEPSISNAEIIRVTAVTGDEFTTILRAQEGTVARTILEGDRIIAGPTKKTFTDIETLLGTAAQVVGVPATASSAGVAGQVAYDSTHFYVCVATDTWVRADFASW